MNRDIPYSDLKFDAQVILAIASGKLPMRPPNSLVAGSSLPDKLWDICERCWARSPLNRPSAKAVRNALTETDALTFLPRELVRRILSLLPLSYIACALRVCSAWRVVIDSDHILWQNLTKSTGLWIGGETEMRFVKLLGLGTRAESPSPSLALGYKKLLKSRYLTQMRWLHNAPIERTFFAGYGTSHGRLASRLLSRDRIVVASDTLISVYSLLDGQHLRTLVDEADRGAILDSLTGTNDYLVCAFRHGIVCKWDMRNWECTRVIQVPERFLTLKVVRPEQVNVRGVRGEFEGERWPKYPLVVVASRVTTGTISARLRILPLVKLGLQETDTGAIPISVSSNFFLTCEASPLLMLL